MVDQHTFLFNDTIYNNIAYGKKGASKSEVLQAAKDAYAYQFIMELPHKFETVVGEGGHSLSGGERQRIAIARAILKDAPILLLDEATASLDSQSEKEVQKALDQLLKNRTAIIIAHRLSTIASADKIIVLKDGKIVESGSHSELIKNGSEYTKLYKLQLMGEETAVNSKS
ncbi:MAG: ATP-binding cassette domain-containing protein, partial [Candidatus Dadabacteria bacterium]